MSDDTTTEATPETEAPAFEPTQLDTLLNMDTSAAPPAPAPEAPQAETPAAAEEPAKPEPEADAKGEDETEATPAPEEEPEDKTVPFKAYEAERHKRQEAEKERDALKPAPEAAPIPDVLEDPEGFRDRVLKDARAENQNARVAMSEEMAKVAHDDYDDVMADYMKAAEANPVLVSEVRKSAHPAETAYQLGLRQRQIAELGDPVAFKEKLTAEITSELTEKITKEVTEKLKDKAAQKDSIPGNLSGERSAGGRKANDPAPRTELSEVLGME